MKVVVGDEKRAVSSIKEALSEPQKQEEPGADEFLIHLTDGRGVVYTVKRFPQQGIMTLSMSIGAIHLNQEVGSVDEAMKIIGEAVLGMRTEKNPCKNPCNEQPLNP